MSMIPPTDSSSNRLRVMPTDDDRQAEPIVRDTADVVAPLPISSRRLSPAQALAVAGERLLWNRRAESWDLEGSVGLTKVVEAVLDACQSSPETVAVDVTVDGALAATLTVTRIEG